MPRSPDLPCADCGKLMWSGATSLPPGQARCLPCRRARPTNRVACAGCGGLLSKGSRGVGLCRTCTQRSCEVCGTPYKPSYGGQRTCGRACGAVIHRPRRPGPAKPEASRLWIRPCDQCGQVFTARRRKSLCSDQCRLERNRIRAKAVFVSQAKVTTKPCEDCGQAYTTQTANNVGVCKRCQRRRRGSYDRKRARYHGVEYEPISRRKVYARDHWRCGICKQPVSPTLKYPNPMSASLDHIVPLAEGGPHLYANVQLAHWQCNVNKGTGGTQQLALVG